MDQAGRPLPPKKLCLCVGNHALQQQHEFNNYNIKLNPEKVIFQHRLGSFRRNNNVNLFWRFPSSGITWISTSAYDKVQFHYTFIISQLWLTSHPRSTAVQLNTGTPCTSRERASSVKVWCTKIASILTIVVQTGANLAVWSGNWHH